MHEQHFDIAGRAQLLQAVELRQRQRLQAGHEDRIAARQMSDAAAGRRRVRVDVPPHRPPEIELPLVGIAEQGGHRDAVPLLVVGRGGEHAVLTGPFPFEDHARPPHLVFVEESRDPPRGRERLAMHVERDAELIGIRLRDHMEHGEREPVERPGIGLAAPRRLEQGEDRARVGQFDVGHDAVAAAGRPAALAHAAGQFAPEPRLRPGRRHDDPRLGEEVTVALEKLDRRGDDFLQVRHVADGERHDGAGYTVSQQRGRNAPARIVTPAAGISSTMLRNGVVIRWPVFADISTPYVPRASGDSAPSRRPWPACARCSRGCGHGIRASR